MCGPNSSQRLEVEVTGMQRQILDANVTGASGWQARSLRIACSWLPAFVLLWTTFSAAASADTGFILSPRSVAGGIPAQGTITLSDAAPAGGVAVTLSSDSSSVQVPAGVSVPAGATTATFTVTTQSVASVTPVIITAKYAGQAQAAALTVVPSSLDFVLLDPTALPGGLISQGTLLLTGPAPPGGAVIAFASDHPAFVRLPSNVTVPAGATAAAFDVITRPVPVPTLVRVAAVYAGAIKMVALTLAPVAINSFTVPSAPIPGGDAALATITLNAPAPPGGAQIVLASDNPEVAAVPLSVTVAAGDDRVTFPVDTAVVGDLSQAVITASYGGETRSAVLAVSSLKLVFLRIGRESVAGGTSVVGALQVSQIAPAGGLAVTLASDRPDIAVGPERVLVLDGTSVTFFLVTTKPVTEPTPVTLTATLGGVTQGVVLLVLPPEG